MSAEAIDVVNEWLRDPDTKARIQQCVDDVVAAFLRKLDNYSVRAPRSDELRSNRFKAWRLQLKSELAQVMQSSFETYFPEIALHLSSEPIYDAFLDNVWPHVEKRFSACAEERFIAYAIEGITIPWVRRHLGDAIFIETPEHITNRWIVPLSSPRDRVRIGSIALDEDGNVLESESSTRANLLAAIDG